MFTFHLVVAVKSPACLVPREGTWEKPGQPIVCSHTRQHFLLLTHKTSPLIGSVVYRRSAGNNNKHVFTPEPFTQENTCTHTLLYPLTHTDAQLLDSRLLYLATVGDLSFKSVAINASSDLM